MGEPHPTPRQAGLSDMTEKGFCSLQSYSTKHSFVTVNGCYPKATMTTTLGSLGPGLRNPSRYHVHRTPQQPADQALEEEVTFLKVMAAILSPGMLQVTTVLLT